MPQENEPKNPAITENPVEDLIEQTKEIPPSFGPAVKIPRPPESLAIAGVALLATLVSTNPLYHLLADIKAVELLSRCMVQIIVDMPYPSVKEWYALHLLARAQRRLIDRWLCSEVSIPPSFFIGVSNEDCDY